MIVSIVRRVLLHNYRNLFFVALAFILSTVSLRLSPALLPTVLNLTVLLTYSRIFVPRHHALKYAALLWLALTIGGSVPKFKASRSALSSPGASVVVLLATSGLNSLFPVFAVVLDTKLCMRFSSAWSQVTLFPSLWVALWSGVAYISPIGRLSTWSPTEGTEAYSWLIPFLGPTAIDWIVAAWAAILSQIFAAWFMHESSITPDIPGLSHERTKLSQGQSSTRLAVLLMALAIPSYYVHIYPAPILSQHTTPLSVACVLPPPGRYKHFALSLDDYIKESQALSAAKILIWPESSVVFNSNSEKEAAFKEIRERVRGPYVGVSFEEAFADPTDKSGLKGARRNGFALISNHSEETHLVYYKRKLVPIAESFSLTHSEAPPKMFTIELPPHGMRRGDWGPPPNYTRPLPVTVSICLDFADPYPFSNLETRPALILAPARTWDFDISVAMWKQAKQRAEELGTMVLWCDGGDGAVSGVAGQGMNDVEQVGLGSWIRSIGVGYPHKESRTWYAFLGGYSLLLLWCITFVPLLASKIHFFPSPVKIIRIRHGFTFARSFLRRPRSGETRPLLGGERGPLVDLLQ